MFRRSVAPVMGSQAQLLDPPPRTLRQVKKTLLPTDVMPKYKLYSRDDCALEVGDDGRRVAVEAERCEGCNNSLQHLGVDGLRLACEEGVHAGGARCPDGRPDDIQLHEDGRRRGERAVHEPRDVHEELASSCSPFSVAYITTRSSLRGPLSWMRNGRGVGPPSSSTRRR